MTPTIRTTARRILGTIAAAAAAIGLMTAAAAVPARADDGRDLARALAALAIMGVIINEIDKDDDRARPKPHHVAPRWTPPAPPRHVQPHRDARRHDRRDDHRGPGWNNPRRDDRHRYEAPRGRIIRPHDGPHRR